jgi:hypothetical protein
MSDAGKLKTFSTEHKQKISEGKIGKSFSDEHKQRISDSLRKYHQEGMSKN